MSIASIALTTTLGAVVMHSARSRDASIGQVELRRLAEHVRATSYLTCGSPVAYDELLDAVTDDLADRGITATVVDVAFWQPDSADPGAVSTFVGRADLDEGNACPDDVEAPHYDYNLQRLTVEVSYASYTRQLAVVKRYFK